MAHLQYFNYPGVGEAAKVNLGYTQAVRIGSVIEISGQGGWDRESGNPSQISDDLATEIAQAFENVDVAVKTAGGAGWSEVYKVVSYHCPPLDDLVLELMVAGLKKWCPEHQPLWTCIGVAKLALEKMHVEIEVKTHVKQ